MRRPEQDRIFIAGEGDRWFARNREALENFDPGRDLVLRLIEIYDLKPQSVLEVGAANGVRLAAIVERLGGRGLAMDPSMAALKDGRVKFPGIAFVCGVAHACPLVSAFDLIIVNFVFHWIDRGRLLPSVAEVDRLLTDGGHLIVGDFHPSSLTKVPYHHLADPPLYTYKQNYAAIFMASGLYYPVGFLMGAHNGGAPTGEAPEEERIGTWLLRKVLQDAYLEAPRAPGASTAGASVSLRQRPQA